MCGVAKSSIYYFEYCSSIAKSLKSSNLYISFRLTSYSHPTELTLDVIQYSISALKGDLSLYENKLLMVLPLSKNGLEIHKRIELAD